MAQNLRIMHPMLAWPKVFLSRMNGWAVSLLIHGGVAAVAGLSVFTVQISGGSGKSAGGAAGLTGSLQAFSVTLHSADEAVVSGTPLPDLAQYSRLSSASTPAESIPDEPPVPPPIPFDVFAVGSSETQATPALLEPFADPSSFPPGHGGGRSMLLPKSSGDGQESDSGASGQGGSGGGESSGNGAGEGSGIGDGAATGIYTPAPAYPSEAKRRNIEGSVLVEFAIEPDGSCEIRRILQSSGFSPLDDAVEHTVRQWKYRAATDDGRAGITTKKMRFTFRLGQ